MTETTVKITGQVQHSPADVVISKVKELINSGAGDRLPAERKLAYEFGFGRTQILEALNKLEFY